MPERNDETVRDTVRRMPSLTHFGDSPPLHAISLESIENIR
jgi:hypothetical protein